MDGQSLKFFAKKLIPLSIENGQVSESLVNGVLLGIKGSHFSPVQQKRILKYYLGMVKRELRKSQAIVEYKGDLSSVAVKLIQEKLSAFYSRTIIVVPKENPELLAGIRISIGDDVWDSSIQGRLMNFQQRLSI